MRASTLAMFATLALSAGMFAGPRATGIPLDSWPRPLLWSLTGAILVALFVMGREDRLEEAACGSWVDDPRKSRLQNWTARRREQFSPRRGLGFFFCGLVIFSIMVGIDALLGESVSLLAGIAFVLIMSLVAGLFGMFTEKVPF